MFPVGAHAHDISKFSIRTQHSIPSKLIGHLPTKYQSFLSSFYFNLTLCTILAARILMIIKNR